MRAVEFNAGIRTASRLDGLKFLTLHNLPTYLKGLFTRSRLWVNVFSRLQPDPMAVKFLNRLYRKYRSRGLEIRRATVLLFDVEAVGHVLRHSPSLFADPQTKRSGMSRFQPEALTISRGEAWRVRREFNERVLALGRLHPLADGFAELIRREVQAAVSDGPARWKWPDFQRLFQRISTGVIFGRSASDDAYLMRALQKLMRNANRAAIVPRQPRQLAAFQQAVMGYLRYPEPGSLAELCQAGLRDNSIAAASQVTHWMFAMNETLAINCVRAAALLASQSEAASVLQQAGDFPAETPPSARPLPSPPLLVGALQEAMRLWPTTPYIARQLLRKGELCGQSLAAGTQILIANAWFHRSSVVVEDGDRFQPQRWVDRPADPRFNHLSNGSQGCAGRDLALFLGAEVLLQLFHKRKWSSQRPVLPAEAVLPQNLNHFAVVFTCSPAP